MQKKRKGRGSKTSKKALTNNKLTQDGRKKNHIVAVSMSKNRKGKIEREGTKLVETKLSQRKGVESSPRAMQALQTFQVQGRPWEKEGVEVKETTVAPKGGKNLTYLRRK